ncbi:Hydrolase, NUDIX family [Rhodovulum sp. P5]|uniref:NUDIX hydrolase n=1 Tax=Rhodovulum sp. P5 TaxID=1564506 RepID=UPI0009C38C29|nr:NUDIX hydrolase [Rhodovulum sp. P5]ARE40135.1 Hydrolase, NUDIX family [Rhodovulum sp. P5]
MADGDGQVIGDQIAALPMRWDNKGKLWVLMVTSRDTGRWVMPKGWRIDGKKPWKAAGIEALEEAGAVGRIGRKEIGQYHYDKRLDDGGSVWCRVRVYPMLVEKLLPRWKERRERKRHWFTPHQAAKRVMEPELAELLRHLENEAHKRPEIRPLYKVKAP